MTTDIDKRKTKLDIERDSHPTGAALQLMMLMITSHLHLLLMMMNIQNLYLGSTMLRLPSYI